MLPCLPTPFFLPSPLLINSFIYPYRRYREFIRRHTHSDGDTIRRFLRDWCDEWATRVDDRHHVFLATDPTKFELALQLSILPHCDDLVDLVDHNYQLRSKVPRLPSLPISLPPCMPRCLFSSVITDPPFYFQRRSRIAAYPSSLYLSLSSPISPSLVQSTGSRDGGTPGVPGRPITSIRPLLLILARVGFFFSA